MKIGFVGLGNMGHFMAANLQTAGHDLRVNDLRPDSAAALIANGATWADTPRSTADGVEAVFLSLPAPPDVEAVLAWTVREAATNVIRHSGARHSAIRLVPALGEATVEVSVFLFGCVLGLTHYLDESRLVKQGLRFLV